ncbi:MAG TPA: LytTR family DNA-binding domain-containing protein [Pyrinomonadaceae bacterium]|nr:LytTR family DNA-binding domain-containing protein [Pyrinomonadaceae bacterium]
MPRIRTIIADDEPLARRGIRAQLKDEKDFEVISECRNGHEAVKTIETESPDLVFLDVQMPELDGFGVVNAVGPARMPAVIFVTAYDRYALRAFEVHALDYLLKPFDDDRFASALQRARQHIERKDIDDLGRRLQGLLDDLQPRNKYVDRLVIKSAGRIFFLSVAEVDWIEAADNYVRLHAGSESHLLRETMNNLEKKLDPDQFLRIHRSRIVNIQRVKELRPLFRGEYDIMLKDGTRLETGRGYRDRVQRLLNDSPR